MDLYSIILIPFLFGLIGFLEPCSFGINVVFLNHIQKYSLMKRVVESVIFALVRGFVLALVGLSAAFIGSEFIQIQSSLFVVLGIVYVLLGLFVIFRKSFPSLRFSIDLSKFVKNKQTLPLAVLFGFIIPACSIPFIIVLIGQALLLENLAFGFITLFIFGVTLSLPLVIISGFEHSNRIIRWLSKKAKNMTYIAGILLILFGLLTFLSRNWWLDSLVEL